MMRGVVLPDSPAFAGKLAGVGSRGRLQPRQPPRERDSRRRVGAQESGRPLKESAQKALVFFLIG